MDNEKMNFQFFALLFAVFYLLSMALCDEPVAFSAIKGEQNGPYISFKTMLVNNTAKFNPLYGVFMCSEPGIYFFTFQVLSQSGRDLRVSLRTNRIPVVNGFGGSKTSFNMATGTAILQLEADDIVYCFVEDGEFYESRQLNRAYTSFSGFRIGSVSGSGGGFFSSLIGRNAPKSNGNNFNEKNKPQNELLSQIDLKDNIFNLLNNSKNSTNI